MRHILAASIVLSSILIPAAANAKTPVDDAAATAPEVRVSTGVVSPTLLDRNPSIMIDSIAGPGPGEAQVGVSFTVEDKGHPQNVHVIKSLSPAWDSRVMDAVSRFHYAPGKLDDQIAPVDVNMTVYIAH